MNNRTYVIIEADDVSTVDFDEVMETSADTLRWSVDESQTFVKFVGDTPSFLVGKTQYNHDEIRAVLATEDWTTPTPPE
tara:strand:- start:337 stop:573 length:237 start_codon:yes stop_codon:yes gene_type:complete